MKRLLMFIASFLLLAGSLYATEVDIDHEEGDWTDWSSYVSDADLTIAGAAGMAGSSYGMQVVINDTTALYGQKTQGDIGSSHWRQRFYFDINTLTMAQYDTFTIAQCYTNGSPYGLWKFEAYYNGSNYQIKFSPYNDSGALTANYQTITDDVHYIEFYIQRAASDVSSDGQVDWWIDGVGPKNTWSSVDNYDVFVDTNVYRFGLPTGSDVDVGTSGTILIDEILLNDTGDAIGAHSEGGIGAKAGFYYYQQNQ